ncbi:MAG: DUF308 domain-containing protein [Clostridia bacterium]|nr:DUF308 domain-containing protein [Clostridia bacterium]
MKSLQKYFGGMILSLLEIFVGVLLLINPFEFTSGIIMVLGAILLFVGLICLFRYFREEAGKAALEQNMFKALIALSVGGFCVLGNGFIVEISAFLAFVYGAIMLVTGFSKVQKTVDMLRLKKTKWYFTAISAGITVVCAVLILFNASTAAEWIFKFIGITLIVEAVIDAIAVLFGGKDKVEEPVGEETEKTEEPNE